MRRLVAVRQMLFCLFVGIFGVTLSACSGPSYATQQPPSPITTSAPVAASTTIPTAAPTALPTPLPTATPIIPTVQLLVTPTPKPPSTASSGSATAPGATRTPASVPQPLPSRGQNCGTIQTRGPQVVDTLTAQQVADCFWQAYQRCSAGSAATLTVTEMGVDTFRTRVFTLDGSGSGCTIQEMTEFRVIPRGTTTATAICASLMRDPNGALHFRACGSDGDVIIPLSAKP